MTSRRCSFSIRPALVSVALVACSSTAAADVGDIEPGHIVDQPQPTGMPLDRVRQNAALSLGSGITALMCPNAADTCVSDVGMFVALTVLHRPETWFAWGALLEGFSAGQAWRKANDTLLLTHHAGAGRVLAELHPLSDYGVDPYFGLGLGVGVISSDAEMSSRAAAQVAEGALKRQITTWSPFYAARLGVDLRVTQRISLGVVADWSNFQALTGENCPWKAFGLCSSSGWGAFPEDNAVWKLGAALSFAFGQEL